ncbi:hypothetical protein L494_1523 [Bordetella bronchiseptica CA90 BB1334]|nr:hypothetical protein L494_1523 [Bordetella bronchiseptica CA90 BB1334]KDD41851.1 hypothetical protein L532_1550 [Bordetella bronchiseptica OSU095]
MVFLTEVYGGNEAAKFPAAVDYIAKSAIESDKAFEEIVLACWTNYGHQCGYHWRIE